MKICNNASTTKSLKKVFVEYCLRAIKCTRLSDVVRNFNPAQMKPISPRSCKELNKFTGWWGEKHVYHFLRDEYKHDSSVIVDWVNGEKESGKPYDIEVRFKDRIDYVEVKSTRTESKRNFELSFNELNFASLHGDNYVICRVFLAGTENSSRHKNGGLLSWYRDPSRLLQGKGKKMKLMLCPLSPRI